MEGKGDEEEGEEAGKKGRDRVENYSGGAGRSMDGHLGRWLLLLLPVTQPLGLSGRLGSNPGRWCGGDLAGLA